jgi:two-component system sensor histidine kinase EvgS
LINFHRLSLCLIALGFMCSSLTARADSWSLLVHLDVPKQSALVLSQPQQQWLSSKQTLKVGIRVNDSPPYGMRTLTREFEGLSADYLAQIAAQLNLKVEVVRFESDDKLWRALTTGEIDLVPSVTHFPANNRFISSDPYAIEQPVLAVKTSDNQALPKDLANTRVAIAADYLTLSDIQKVYPEARIQVFDTYQEALSAVAYGNARVYIGNSYPIGRNYFNNLRIEQLAALPERKVGFALRRDNSQLLLLINQAMKVIPVSTRLALQHYWQTGVGSDTQSLKQPLKLTDTEHTWIQSHPVINVLLYGKDNTAPAAFFDDSGNVRGIAIDVLSLVALKTGLRFSFKSNSDMESLIRDINSSEADMAAALAPSQERREELLFSYPYSRSAFALITAPDNDSVKRLADLRGKRLALIRKAALGFSIAEHYPEIKLVYYNNDADLFESVIDGKADALVGLLISAEYQLNNRYRDQLKIANIIGSNPAQFAFAVGKSDPELLSILNKFMMTIPPDELEMIANRWRPNNMIVVDNFWQRNRLTFMAIGLGTGFVLLAILAWLLWLQQQVEKGKRLRLQMKEQVQMLERLMDALPFPMALRDRQLRLVYSNQLYLEHMQQPYQELLGRSLSDSPVNRTPEQSAMFENLMHQVMQSNQPYNADHEIELLNGEQQKLAVNVWLLPWHDGKGNVIGVLAGMWDISERQTLLRQLSEASERAEASNRAKSTFLSTMSHEIRTPMNAIIGMLDMAIKAGKLGEQDLQALEVAHEAANGLVGLIGDILDLSRVEGGEMEFRPVPINLGLLINQLLVIFNGLALDKNITLSKHFPEEAIVDVVGDPLRIKQVLSNILGNAIKFTDAGGVKLKILQNIDFHLQLVSYVIEVQDSGVGIPEAQQAALFQPFSQADNHRAGTGLGLYISRNLCKKMGGDLSLSSVLNEGTCVRARFTLPMAQKPIMQHREDEAPSKTTKPLNVLVVDDNAANRILLAKQLAWLGHHAHVAADAFEGFEIWQLRPFDVVITDCNMPGMNGYQFTQRIRESEQQHHKRATYILGFTANAMQEIVERCQTAGMDGCLFKPCSINQLDQALSLYTHPVDLSLADMKAQDVTFKHELQQRVEKLVRKDFSMMQRAAEQQNWQQLGELAHRMTGSVLIGNETELAEVCQHLEQRCLHQPLQADACQSSWEVAKNKIIHWLDAAESVD